MLLTSYLSFKQKNQAYPTDDIRAGKGRAVLYAQTDVAGYHKPLPGGSRDRAREYEGLLMCFILVMGHYFR